MRKIAVVGTMLLTLAVVGCSKKTEEHATEGTMAPPAQEQAAPAPAPMPGMEQSKPAEQPAAPGAPEAPSNPQGQAPGAK